MAGRKGVAPALLAGLALSAAGCGGSAAPPPTPTPTAGPPTPTLPDQITRAQRRGPGELDYCPRHNGLRTAKYQIDVPGDPVVPGWCKTVARREAGGDIVTFTLHWDARKVIGHAGTMVLTYRVPRSAGPLATPVPQQIAQSGVPPP